MFAFRDDASEFSESQDVRTVAETDDLQQVEEDDAYNFIGTQESGDEPTHDHWDNFDEERASFFRLPESRATEYPGNITVDSIPEYERETCFVCREYIPMALAREGFDFWRIHGVFTILLPRGVPGDFMDVPHERSYILCRACIRRVFHIRYGPRSWTQRPYFRMPTEETFMDRLNLTAAGLPSVHTHLDWRGRLVVSGNQHPSIHAHVDTLPSEGDAAAPGWRGRYVVSGDQLPIPPPPPPRGPTALDVLELFRRPHGPQPRHLAEAPWHAYGERGDGDSSGDGEEGDHQQESESSENPWADIE